MNKKQKKEYINGGYNLCPYCKSNNIVSLDSVQADSSCAWQEIECSDCGKVWRDVYKLVDVEEIA